MIDLSEIATSAASRIARRLPDSRLAKRGRKGRTWRQRQVAFLTGEERQAVSVLVADAVAHRFNRFLPIFDVTNLPDALARAAVAVVTVGGVCVRASAQYELYKDRTLYRLDLMGKRV